MNAQTKWLGLIGIVGTLLMVPVAKNGDLSFTGRSEFGTGATIGMAWGDADRDGDPDMAVGNYFNQPNAMFVNNGTGAFVQQPAFGSRNTFAVAWADVDNDGDLDLSVGNDQQGNYLYVNNGDGTFVQQDQFGAWRTIALAWADSDLDGDLDLAVGNGILGTVQQNLLYVNNGDGTFTGQNQFGTGQTDSLAWADFDDDGDPDLAVGNGGFGFVGQNYLYVNNGDGTFSEQAKFGLGDTAVVAWADANGDGRLDLAVGNWNNGQNLLYVNNGDDTFTELAAFGARDTNTLAWGDVDHDGDMDVAVGNGDFSSADQNYLYLNDGTGSFTELPNFGLGSTDGICFGDADGDGDLDVAVGNEHTPTQNEVWINDLNDNRYLQLRLIGQRHAMGAGFSNRDGIGAVVCIYDEGHAGEPAFLQACQQVEAKGGFSSQNDMLLTFGVPDGQPVDMQIRWPGSSGSSLTQILSSVAPGQRLEITEAAPSVITEVVPNSFMVTRGTYVSGGIAELAVSDNADLSIRRSTTDTQSRTEFTVNAFSPVAAPAQFEVTLEGAVFARSTVNQSIELFNYNSSTWEQINSSVATPMVDSIVTVAATGDLSRFVQQNTLTVDARIRYQSVNPRQRFSSNTDRFIWMIGQ